MILALFTKIHCKAFECELETYKFWKAFGEAFICNAKIHNPFSISDVTELLNLLKNNKSLKLKFKEFLLANRILPSSSKRHIELKSNLKLFGYSGASATIDEREIDSSKITEKYRNTVYKSFINTWNQAKLGEGLSRPIYKNFKIRYQ